VAPRLPYLAPSAVLFRTSMREGIFGDSRFWKIVALLIISRRAFRKIMGSDPRTVAIERIKPGETVVLRGVRSRKLPT
jgi:hypothetical protein